MGKHTQHGYESLAQMEKQMPQDYRDKWVAKSTEANTQALGQRTRVKGELWRLVVATTPPAAAKASTE